jgi:hypothetical protein
MTLWQSTSHFYIFEIGSSFIIISLRFVVQAQTLGQTDTFQDGTLNFWSSGTNNPSPPFNIPAGGSAGISDKYMHAASTGGSGAGSKLVLQNSNQWTGNFIAAGIGNILMSLKNEGSSALQMRIAILSASGSCSSVNAVLVPVSSGWITVNFPISASALIGGTVNTILTSVTEIRLLHEGTPGTKGDPIAAQLGVDNITATATATGVEEVSTNLPQIFSLAQNYPNPFNPSTRITYSLPAEGKMQLSVYNILGQQVAMLATGVQTAGAHEVIFDASGLPSGAYFYRLEGGSNVQVKKLVLSK